MADLRPVEPRGRRAAARGWLVAMLIVLIVGTAVVKPWSWRAAPPLDESSTRPLPTAVISSATSMPPLAAQPVRPARLPLFRSDIFDFVGTPPAWEVLIGVLIGDFSLAGHVPVIPRAPEGLDLAADPLDLGAADHLVALAINHPSDVPLADVRLWRFPDDQRRPFRVPLVQLPSPKRNQHLRVIGLQVRYGSSELSAWPPGSYRLDLLVGGSGNRVLSVALRARENSDGRPERGRQPPGAFAQAPVIAEEDLHPGQLLARGTLDDLVVPRQGDGNACGVAELWRAGHGAGARCRSTPARLIGAVGVGMPRGTVASSATFRRLDPLPVTVGRVTVGAMRRTVVVTTTDQRPFPDGTYELDVIVEGGRHLRWYLEVEPGGGEITRVGATH